MSIYDIFKIHDTLDVCSVLGEKIKRKHLIEAFGFNSGFIKKCTVTLRVY